MAEARAIIRRWRQYYNEDRSIQGGGRVGVPFPDVAFPGRKSIGLAALAPI